MRNRAFLFIVGLLLISINSNYAQWVIRRPMRFARSGAMVATVNSKLYVIGGFVNQNTTTSNVEEYNPVLDTWVTKAPMPTPRGEGICGVVGGKIYVIGGYRTGNTPTETVEVYDPSLNQWQRRRRMPMRRSGYNGGVIDDSIYVCSGYTMTYTDTVEVYCVSRDSWFTRSSVNQARVEFGAAVVQNRLYTTGGLFFSSYLNSTEEYNPTEDTWRTKTPIPFSRTGLACTGLGNKLYAIGGERHGPRVIYNRVDVYDVNTELWTVADSINIARSFAGAATINNHIYVTGGMARNGSPTASLEEYIPVGIDETSLLSIYLSKLTVFPNPFQYETKIQFSNFNQQSASVKIYDKLGNLVKTFNAVSGSRSAKSEVIWDGTDCNHARVSSGVYFAKITNCLNQYSLPIKIIVSK